jgi:hypothetical protein
MKKRTKIMTVVISLALIGGGIMLNNNYKTNGNIFDFTSREDRQLAYLKEHEQEIVDFVKSVNPKVESVQIDWNDVRRSDGMAFETSEFVHLYGEFNHNHETSWHVQIEIKEDGYIDLENMILVNGLRIGGNYFE